MTPQTIREAVRSARNHSQREKIKVFITTLIWGFDILGANREMREHLFGEIERIKKAMKAEIDHLRLRVYQREPPKPSNSSPQS